MTPGHSSGRASEILAEVVNGSAPRDQLAQRMVAACTRALPVTGAGLAVMTDLGPGGMLAASDGPAAVVEDLQFTLGEGPCVDSVRTGRPVLDADLEQSGRGRWPHFTPGALDAGVRAVFAFPLMVHGIRVGALDLYRDAPGGLTTGAIHDAQLHADAATMLLLRLQAERPSLDGAAGWAAELEDRSEVHQATGMISVQSGVSVESALLLLRARAFAAERPIDAVARDVVSRIVRFDTKGRVP